MNNVWYLAIVVLLSAVGLLVVWLRNRPSSPMKSSIEQFNDKMRALSPEMAIKHGPGVDAVPDRPEPRSGALRGETSESS